MPANQTIPITLQWGPTGEQFTAADINELGTFLARQLSGSIRKDVSFYLEVLFDPTSQVSGVNRIFNITQRVDKAWEPSVGGNLPVVNPTNTQNLPGAAAFSSIVKPVVLPPNGGMSATYEQSEAEALRDSAAAIEVQAAAIQDACSTLLLSLRSSTTPLLYAQVFAGFP